MGDQLLRSDEMHFIKKKYNPTNMTYKRQCKQQAKGK